MSDAENYLRDLHELGVDRSKSLDEKIEQAISIGRDRFGVAYGLLSYTGDGEYEVVDSTRSDGTYVAGSVHDIETTWCRHVVDDREPLSVADAENSEYQDDVAYQLSGVQCYIGAPVVVDGETYGTLCYGDEEPLATAFTDDEERFVDLLARWLGYELERANNRRRLEAQNERLDEFAGVLAHDLRGPLTTARAYTELAAESVPEAEAAHLETALDALDRMDALVGETLLLAREGIDVGEREPVELSAVAHTAWESVQPDNATLTVETDRTVLADASRLRQLLEALFYNVAAHCGPGTAVTVRGTDDGFVVADDGPGLPASLADALFDGETDSPETGVGLGIVERITAGHGWTGTVERDNGTRFVFSGVGTAAQAR